MMPSRLNWCRKTRTVNSHDLIETARRLTASGAAPPTQADLRRAVSTAYYGLFHCLAGTAADLLSPAPAAAAGNGIRCTVPSSTGRPAARVSSKT